MSKTGVRFFERMAGRVEPAGGGTATRVVMRGTVCIESVDDFLDDPNHAGALEGSVRVDGLSQGWTPAAGHVRLFSMGRIPGERLMEYFMTFEVEGRQHDLVGVKYVCDDRGFDVWADVTTLNTTIMRHEPDGRLTALSSGILRLSFFQSIVLLLTLRGTGSGGLFAKSCVVARFGMFFAGEVSERFLPAAPRRRIKG